MYAIRNSLPFAGSLALCYSTRGWAFTASNIKSKSGTFVVSRKTTPSFTTTSSSILRMMSSNNEILEETNPRTMIPGRPTWQQTMLRIKDPEKSIAFYEGLGCTLVDKFDFPQYDFSLYFMTTIPENEEYTLTPGTQEAHDYLWTMEGTALELTHNYGTESDPEFKGYHAGNEEKDGFGHVAFNCDDVYEVTDELLSKGVEFKKKPDEGRMKGLAFAKDPDGYWVELVKRREIGNIGNKFNFSQTMIRVKDPKKSIEFYRAFGMSLLYQYHGGDFSLYYLASNIPQSQDLYEHSSVNNLFGPVLELTHNHGTENDDEFKHFNGNEDGRQGFGHIGFLVDDVYAACDSIRDFGYGFRKEPDGGSMKGLAFAFDPDGYSVEIVPRGGIDFGDVLISSSS